MGCCIDESIISVHMEIDQCFGPCASNRTKIGVGDGPSSTFMLCCAADLGHPCSYPSRLSMSSAARMINPCRLSISPAFLSSGLDRMFLVVKSVGFGRQCFVRNTSFHVYSGGSTGDISCAS
ncbi:unnamed protein product [Hapterophycus canaliculatus]